MAIESLAGAIWVATWINMKHDLRDLAPIGAGCVRIDEAQVSHKVLLIVHGEHRISRRAVGDIRIKRRILHRLPIRWPFAREAYPRPEGHEGRILALLLVR